tara:strand:+ start:1703 stop:1948 length:246 start_codon:yes stop_codon:yes gene_type:complete
MSTVSELRQEAQDKGQKLVDEYNTLDEQKQEILKQSKEIQVKQNKILMAVEKINGEIEGYNKIEPPVASVPAGETSPPDAA